MKKKIISAFVILLLLLSVVVIGDELTKELTTESDNTTINAGYEELKGDQYLFNSGVLEVSNKSIYGNVFACSNSAIVLDNVIIDGNLFIMSNNIQLNDVAVNGSIFAMGNIINSKESYANDLYLLGKDVTLNGNFDREVKILGQTVILDCEIDGKLYVDGGTISINDKARLFGEATVNYSDELNQSDNAICTNLKIEKDEVEEIAQNNIKMKAKKELKSWFTELIKTLIFAGIILLLGNKGIENYSNSRINKPGKFAITTLKGFAWLVLIPIASILITIISFGILVGFSVLLVLAYASVIYLSLQIVSVFLSTFVQDKVFKQKDNNVEFLLSTLITMSIIWILGKFPIIGAFVWVIVVFASLGIIVDLIINRKCLSTTTENEKDEIKEITDEKKLDKKETKKTGKRAADTKKKE